MPAVTLNKGRYWVGNPESIFPNWKPNETCVYKKGNHTFFAFQFGEEFVAAIPEQVVPEEVFFKPKQSKDEKDKVPEKIIPRSFMVFLEPTLFYEMDGVGAIGSVSL